MNCQARTTLLAVSILLLAGCAFTPQEAQLTVATQVDKADIGKGREVYVHVVDERTTTEIGRRGNGVMDGAAITTTQDIAALFRDAVKAGITNKGFVVVPDASGSTRQLRVDIRTLEYEMSMGFWSGGVHTRAALKATVLHNGAAQYDNLYRDEAEDRVQFVPGAKANDERINMVIDGVITKLFADEQLLSVLARDP